MSLIGRHWKRGERTLVPAAGLLVVSFEPWSGITRGGASESTFSAWATRRWSAAVLLALLAALLLLAYRSRNPRGAAGVAVVMLALGLGVAAWEWWRPQAPLVTEVTILTVSGGGEPEPSKEEIRRRYEEAIASGGGIVYRTEVRWGFFAGTAAMGLMLATTIRLFRSAPESTPDSHG